MSENGYNSSRVVSLPLIGALSRPRSAAVLNWRFGIMRRNSGALDMKLGFERTDGVVVVKSCRRVDGRNAEAFRRAVLDVFEDSDRALVIDFEPLEYIGSTGLRAILMIAKKVSGRGAGFSICALGVPIEQVFTVGLHKIVSIHETKEQALASINS